MPIIAPSILSADFAKLGESSERVERLSLRLLGDVSQAAAFGRGEPDDWRLKLFVSHAKLDSSLICQAMSRLNCRGN